MRKVLPRTYIPSAQDSENTERENPFRQCHEVQRLFLLPVGDGYCKDTQVWFEYETKHSYRKVMNTSKTGLESVVWPHEF